ncbi:TIR domain-containing protein [Brevundimonas subvibrioides]|uniref:TIR domain-containing protein n=1 Tax=Brevundimonas subvibrioides TaxID=74313 RepID=UPI0022B34BEC|nr:TIR domain-containing protein [Brevundimonas subvibrioides]
MTITSAELLDLADKADALGDRAEAVGLAPQQLDSLKAVAGDFGRSWSGSNLGYHSSVYFRDFKTPPPGAHFSTEWGLQRSWPSPGSSGDWVEYGFDEVREAIKKRAAVSGLDEAAERLKPLRAEVEALQKDLISILTLTVSEHSQDAFLANLLVKANQTKVETYGEYGSKFLRSGRVISRDSLAVSQGFAIAAHQSIDAEISALKAPSRAARELSLTARQAGSHLSRVQRSTNRQAMIGTNVFIGHGQSPVWRDLKDFISERLHLPYDEFNRVPVAGVTNIARLSEMLDSAALAFVVLTAEDEQSDGDVRARQNVVHEAGLFQGRLGFSKAIILLEEGCQPFSNIDGLGQIRFPRGDLKSKFEEIRRVLEREGLLATPTSIDAS